MSASCFERYLPPILALTAYFCADRACTSRLEQHLIKIIIHSNSDCRVSSSFFSFFFFPYFLTVFLFSPIFKQKPPIFPIF